MSNFISHLTTMCNDLFNQSLVTRRREKRFVKKTKFRNSVLIENLFSDFWRSRETKIFYKMICSIFLIFFVKFSSGLFPALLGVHEAVPQPDEAAATPCQSCRRPGTEKIQMQLRTLRQGFQIQASSQSKTVKDEWYFRISYFSKGPSRRVA